MAQEVNGAWRESWRNGAGMAQELKHRAQRNMSIACKSAR